jgi:hypothetical protein
MQRRSLSSWDLCRLGILMEPDLADAFAWFLVPETTGKRLEQIEAYWEQGRTWPDQPQPAEPESRRLA